jgi:hypothetical protein
MKKKKKLKKNKNCNRISTDAPISPKSSIKKVVINCSKKYKKKYDEIMLKDIEKIDMIFSEIIYKPETAIFKESDYYRINFQTTSQFSINFYINETHISISYESNSHHDESKIETKTFYKKWKKELDILVLKFIQSKNEKMFDVIFTNTNIGRKNKIQNFLDQNK